jgi:hypothetical protein
MKNIISRSALLLAILLLFSSVVMTVLAVDPFTSLKNEYSGLEENDVVAALAEKSFEEVAYEVNIISDNGGGLTDLTFHAAALYEKLEDLSDDEFIAFLSDESNSIPLRVTLIQLWRHKNGNAGIGDQTLLQEIVLDENCDSILRRNAVIALSDSDPETVNLLVTTIASSDELLAYQAIKRLNQIDKSEANEISQIILSNIDVSQTEKIRAAIQTLAENYRPLDEGATEKTAFINLCIELHQNSDDEIMKDTIIFSLANLVDFRAISYIVNSDTVDNALKISCIDRNYKSLSAKLESGPTEDTLSVIYTAMSIYPITELIDEYNSHIEQLGQDNWQTIDVQESYPVNSKWLEY